MSKEILCREHRRDGENRCWSFYCCHECLMECKHRCNKKHDSCGKSYRENERNYKFIRPWEPNLIHTVSKMAEIAGVKCFDDYVCYVNDHSININNPTVCHVYKTSKGYIRMKYTNDLEEGEILLVKVVSK